MDFPGRTPPPRKPTYFVTRRVFLALLGVVYLIAFASLWSQIDGLVGSEGILPAAEFIEQVHRAAGEGEAGGGWPVYFQVPTICLLSASDSMLHALCAVGCVLSLVLVAGVAPMATLVLLWAIYLSLAVVCRVFLSFQWDALLLETGFLAIFLAPATLLPRFSRESPPPAAAIWLLRLLLFKFMVASGVVKLTYGDPSWWDGTALSFHYETQPIPAWTSWYVHHLPLWFHKISVWLTLAIEIVVPVLIFFPGRVRLVPLAAFFALMVAVAVTGNYGFFNLLTLVLCLLLVDDSRWPRRLRQMARDAGAVAPRRRWRIAVFAPLACLYGYMLLVGVLVDTMRPQVTLPESLGNVLLKPYPHVAAFRTINSYGLFRVMTKTRPEITIEGSRDGRQWETYEFKWKPGDPARAPAFVQPHMPRLDWQMWFAALRLDAGGMPPWLAQFLGRLATGSEPVRALIERDPFAGGPPPEMIRLTLHSYRFTDAETRRRDGTWWRREVIRQYPPFRFGRR